MQAKNSTVLNIEYIDGGVSDFIFIGKDRRNTCVKMFIPATTIIELAKLLETTKSQPGHVIWHRNSKTPIPCNLCHI